MAFGRRAHIHSQVKEFSIQYKFCLFQFPSVDQLSQMRSESLTAVFDLITQIGSKIEIEADGEAPTSSGGGPESSGDGPDADPSAYQWEDDEDYYQDSYDDASADGEPGP
jgi:hypothetical protein